MEANTLSQGAQKVRDGATEMKNAVVESGAETLEECCDQTESYIKDNPHRSVLMAFGIGAIVGLLLFRRR